MSSKAIAPAGKITQGDYSGCNVYVWETNKNLMIIDGIVDRGLFAAPFYEKKKIDKFTVKSFQLINTTQTTGASNSAIGATAVFFGVSAAHTLMNSVRVNQYNVAIYFTDGKKCVAQLNDAAYGILSSACFVL